MFERTNKSTTKLPLVCATQSSTYFELRGCHEEAIAHSYTHKGLDLYKHCTTCVDAYDFQEMWNLADFDGWPSLTTMAYKVVAYTTFLRL